MTRWNTSFISSVIVVRGSTFIKSEDSAIYCASVVLREISVSKELRQNIGLLAYMMTIPVRDMIFPFLLASSCDQPPSNSASTQHSRPYQLSGVYTIPYLLV